MKAKVWNLLVILTVITMFPFDSIVVLSHVRTKPIHPKLTCSQLEYSILFAVQILFINFFVNIRIKIKQKQLTHLPTTLSIGCIRLIKCLLMYSNVYFQWFVIYFIFDTLLTSTVCFFFCRWHSISVQRSTKYGHGSSLIQKRAKANGCKWDEIGNDL